MLGGTVIGLLAYLSGNVFRRHKKWGANRFFCALRLKSGRMEWPSHAWDSGVMTIHEGAIDFRAYALLPLHSNRVHTIQVSSVDFLEPRRPTLREKWTVDHNMEIGEVTAGWAVIELAVYPKQRDAILAALGYDPERPSGVVEAL